MPLRACEWLLDQRPTLLTSHPHVIIVLIIQRPGRRRNATGAPAAPREWTGATTTPWTELSPQEQETARFRLRELADRFAVDGTLRTSQWQAVYRRTWRHPYVPSYYPELSAGRGGLGQQHRPETAAVGHPSRFVTQWHLPEVTWCERHRTVRLVRPP